MTANEKRIMVRNKYREILGRNRYSQSRRDYCYTKYEDGYYYSDCSSSICHTYRVCGFSFGILNTVGMYESSKLKKVDVQIRNGIPIEVNKLRIGDMLLFAGSDPSRAYAEYVGHVEMVGEISGGVVTLYGHGSGTPSKKSMIAYCGQRQGTRTSTKRGNKGLIKVVRFIQDDDADDPTPDPTSNTLLVQKALLAWNNECLPRWGADGEWGAETESAVKAFQSAKGMEPTGELNHATLCALGLRVAKVKVYGGTVNVRTSPYVDDGNIIGTVKAGDTLLYQGEDKDGWHLVIFKNQNAWISGKWTTVE